MKNGLPQAAERTLYAQGLSIHGAERDLLRAMMTMRDEIEIATGQSAVHGKESGQERSKRIYDAIEQEAAYRYRLRPGSRAAHEGFAKGLREAVAKLDILGVRAAEVVTLHFTRQGIELMREMGKAAEAVRDTEPFDEPHVKSSAHRRLAHDYLELTDYLGAVRLATQDLRFSSAKEHLVALEKSIVESLIPLSDAFLQTAKELEKIRAVGAMRLEMEPAGGMSM